ncbi:hypothetical protein FHY05_003459 [Sphingomonas sp. BK580]|nr:hypothetical protein [Sphingomonas sp. BK580]
MERRLALEEIGIDDPIDRAPLDREASRIIVA